MANPEYTASDQGDAMSRLRQSAISKSLTRREFSVRAALLGASLTIGAGLMAACGGSDSTETSEASGTEASGSGSGAATSGAGSTSAATSPAGSPAGSATQPSAAGTTTTAGGETPKKGGSVTWALSSDPVNLIPFGAIAGSNMWGKEFMYDSLLEWDRNLTIQPALATNYEISPDATVYTFKLRQGVKFHNGKALDSQDVKYSMEQAVNPPTPGVKVSYLESLAKATFEAPAADTFKFTLQGPDPTLPGVFAWQRYTPIVPDGILDQINTLSEGIGTGPFKLVTFVANDRVEYERNPDFWKEGLPYLDKLTLKVLPDEQARVAALRSGAIDGGDFSADTATTFKNDKSVSVLKNLVAAPRVLQFVMHGGEPWADTRVRQAISYAIDRQGIIDKVYGGNAELSGPIPPGYGDWFFKPDQLEGLGYKRDVDKAKQLMEQAGQSKGFSVTLQSIAQPQDYTQIAQVIKENLKDINIDVTVQPLEIGTFAKNNGDGDFQWQQTGRGMRGDPSGFVVDFYSKAGALYDAWFKGGWQNSDFDAAYEEALQISDVDKRHELYNKMQTILLTEYPNVYSVQSMKFQAVRSRLQNMYVSYTDFNTGLREAWVES